MIIVDKRTVAVGIPFNQLQVGSVFKMINQKSDFYVKMNCFGKISDNIFNLNESYSLRLKEDALTFPVNAELIIKD